MSFGKRTPGRWETAESEGAEPAITRSGEFSGVRMAASPADSNPLSAGFLALVLGVVALAGGGALAAPHVIAMFPEGAKPLEKVVAGLNLEQAKRAMQRQAFPDPSGRAFLATLAREFPGSHDQLTTALAQRALAGSDRDGLFLAVNEWSLQFAIENMGNIGRSGGQGFDKLLEVSLGAFDMLEDVSDGCTMSSIQRMSANPQQLMNMGGYGSPIYDYGMRANMVLVETAAAGEGKENADLALTIDDERALQRWVMQLAMDPEIRAMIQTSMLQASTRAAIGGGRSMGPEMMGDFNVCTFGKRALGKLGAMPSATKGRLLHLGAEAVGSGVGLAEIQQLVQAGGGGMLSGRMGGLN